MSSDEQQKQPAFFLIKRRLHGLRRVFFLCLALILAVAGYFHFVGFPQWVVRKLESKLIEHDLYLDVESVKLDFYYGLDAQHVTVYKTILQKKPLLQADSLACRFSAKDLIVNHQFAGRMHLENVQLSPELLPAEIRENFDAPLIRSLDGALSAGKFEVSNSDIQWDKLRIHAAGELFYDQETRALLSKKGGASGPAKSLAGLVWLNDSVRMKDPAELELQFSINTILPERSTLEAKLDGGRVLIRDVFFSDADFALSLTPEVLSLHNLTLKNKEDVLEVSGAIGMADYRAALKINSTLDVKELAHMYSPLMEKRVSDVGITLKDGFQLTLKTGDKDWLKRQDVSGTFFSKSMAVRGVALENLYTSFKHADGLAEITRLRAHVPAGDVHSPSGVRHVKGGELTAKGQWDRVSTEYSARATLGCDPWLIKPLTENTFVANLIRQHEFYDDVELSLSLKGAFDQRDSHSVVGRLTSGSSARWGAKVDAARCEFAYKDSLLTLPTVHVEKDGQESDAVILVNFGTDIIDLNLSGGVDPRILAQMIHPSLAGSLNGFAFNGQNQLECSGSVDYGSWLKTRLEGTYSGTEVSSPVAEVQKVDFNFGMTGPALYFTNINAEVYGGTCQGDVNILMRKDLGHPYQAEVSVHDVGMTEFANYHGEKGGNKNLGNLTGHVQLQGEMVSPVGQHIRGAGSARIEDGWLVELPVLKAFTRAARLVFSQFSTFSQTDCSMDFDIRDGAVHTDNLVLAGDLMTLKAEGRYDFKDGFDATVEMKPFRKNVLTRVVQWASTPFSELLKFSLQGPLSDPTWRLARFPDVTSIFRRSNGEPAKEE